MLRIVTNSCQISVIVITISIILISTCACEQVTENEVFDITARHINSACEDGNNRVIVFLSISLQTETDYSTSKFQKMHTASFQQEFISTSDQLQSEDVFCADDDISPKREGLIDNVWTQNSHFLLVDITVDVPSLLSLHQNENRNISYTIQQHSKFIVQQIKYWINLFIPISNLKQDNVYKNVDSESISVYLVSEEKLTSMILPSFAIEFLIQKHELELIHKTKKLRRNISNRNNIELKAIALNNAAGLYSPVAQFVATTSLETGNGETKYKVERAQKVVCNYPFHTVELFLQDAKLKFYPTAFKYNVFQLLYQENIIDTGADLFQYNNNYFRLRDDWLQFNEIDDVDYDLQFISGWKNCLHPQRYKKEWKGSPHPNDCESECIGLKAALPDANQSNFATCWDDHQINNLLKLKLTNTKSKSKNYLNRDTQFVATTFHQQIQLLRENDVSVVSFIRKENLYCNFYIGIFQNSELKWPLLLKEEESGVEEDFQKSGLNTLNIVIDNNGIIQATHKIQQAKHLTWLQLSSLPTKQQLQKIIKYHHAVVNNNFIVPTSILLKEFSRTKKMQLSQKENEDAKNVVKALLEDNFDPFACKFCA